VDLSGLVLTVMSEEGERYVNLKQVGVGTFGTVFKATDRGRNSERIAIKVIQGGLDSAYATKRVLRELTILRLCRHPCVVNVMEVLHAEALPKLRLMRGDVVYSMELLQIDLASLLGTAEHRQDWSRHHVRFLLYQLLAGVAFLHSRGVLHRDLKPSNLLVNAHCDVKICDFGLALVRPKMGAGAGSAVARGQRSQASPFMGNMRRLGSAFTDGDAAGGGAAAAEPPQQQGASPFNRARTMTTHVVTRWYRAPEVILEWPDYDAAVDMWSVGCIVGEMLESLQANVAQCTPLFMGDKSAMSDSDADVGASDSDDEGDVDRICKELGDRRYQLSAILHIIGFPSEADIDACPSGLKRQCRYLRAFPGMAARRPFNEVFPAAPAEFIELVHGLLVFNPSMRLTAQAALELDIFNKARSSFVKSRKFSLEDYSPATLDITKLVDGFESTKDAGLLENFLQQEIEAWRERGSLDEEEAGGAGGGAAEAKGAKEEECISPASGGRRLDAVHEAKDEAKDEVEARPEAKD
jgi:mitogen-activated protein kinase 1/3